MPAEAIDIPSPIDLRAMVDARAWEESATEKRPWRAEFFAAFANQIAMKNTARSRVLELGSGPGFLAHHLLASLPKIEYVALDFSAAMHALARQRLGVLATRVVFVERSFLDVNWTDDLGQFDCIVTHQAVHEVRHKSRVRTLNAQARALLAPGGSYLMCDHFVGEGGMQNAQLYMTVEEQRTALVDAGFSNVSQVLVKGGLALHHALV